MTDPSIGGRTTSTSKNSHNQTKSSNQESDREKAKRYQEEYDKARAYVKNVNERNHELQNAIIRKDIRFRDLELELKQKQLQSQKHSQVPVLENTSTTTFAYTGIANIKPKDLEIEELKRVLEGKTNEIRELKTTMFNFPSEKLKQQQLNAILELELQLRSKNQMICELSENNRIQLSEIGLLKERLAKYREKLDVARKSSEEKSKALFIMGGKLTKPQWWAVWREYSEEEFDGNGNGNGNGEE